MPFWVGGTGNLTDAANHWAATTGGAPGAGNLPTLTTDAIFDANSGAGSYTITADGAFSARNFDMSAISGTPTLAGSAQISYAANFTARSTIIASFTGTFKCVNATPVESVFAGAGVDFSAAAQLWLAGSGIGAYQVTGANKFNVLKCDKLGAVIRLPNGVSTTVNDVQASGVAPGGSDYAFGRFFGGSVTDGMTTPDAAANRLTGDVAIIAYVAAENWTQNTGINQIILGKRTAASGAASYSLLVPTGGTGKLRMIYSVNGTNALNADSSAATGFADGSGHWVAVSREASTGNIKFWTSNDPATTAPASVTWTQLGTTQAGTAGNLAAGDSLLTAGGLAGNTWAGYVARALLLNSITLTAAAVADYNPATFTTGTTWTSATGEVWTNPRAGIVSATNRIAIISPTNASHTLAFAPAAGHVSLDYVTISRSTGTPANWWFAGSHGINGGNNSGWLFADYVGMIANANAVATMTAALTAQIVLQSSLAVVTTWTGVMGTGIILRADVNAQASITAPLTTLIRLTSLAQGIVTASPNLVGNDCEDFDLPDWPHMFVAPEETHVFAVPENPHVFES